MARDNPMQNDPLSLKLGAKRGRNPARVTYQKASGFTSGRTQLIFGGGCTAAPPSTMSL